MDERSKPLASALYLQELVRVAPGKTDDYIEAMARRGVPLMTQAGLTLIGAWEVQLTLREMLLIWRVESADAFPDEGWLLQSPQVQPEGAAFRRELDGLLESLQGSLMSPVPVVPAPQPGALPGPPRRRLYFHEVQQVLPGKMLDYLGRLAVEALPQWNRAGWRVEGVFRNHVRPRELLWLVSYEQGSEGVFEPKVWIDPDGPMPELASWMAKAWEWRDEWTARLMLPLPFSPLQ